MSIKDYISSLIKNASVKYEDGRYAFRVASVENYEKDIVSRRLNGKINMISPEDLDADFEVEVMRFLKDTILKLFREISAVKEKVRESKVILAINDVCSGTDVSVPVKNGAYDVWFGLEKAETRSVEEVLSTLDSLENTTLVIWDSGLLEIVRSDYPDDATEKIPYWAAFVPLDILERSVEKDIVGELFETYLNKVKKTIADKMRYEKYIVDMSLSRIDRMEKLLDNLKV